MSVDHLAIDGSRGTSGGNNSMTSPAALSSYRRGCAMWAVQPHDGNTANVIRAEESNAKLLLLKMCVWSA